MEQWGVFTLKDEVEKTVQQVKNEGLEIFEVRELTFLERLTYCKNPVELIGGMWIVMFYATKEQYNALITKYDLGKVF